MARTAQQGLSKHPTKGFRISIGHKQGGGYRTFWLGRDRMVAEYGAEMYRRNWDGIEVSGGKFWTADVEEKIRHQIDTFRHTMTAALPGAWDAQQKAIEQRRDTELAKLQKRQQQTVGDTFGAIQAQVPAAEAPQPESPKGLYTAIKAYLDAFKGKRRADSHKQRAKEILDGTLKRVRADCPLSSIDFLWLDGLADHFKARPKIRSGKSMSPGTVKVTLQYLRQFFIWLDDVSYDNWEAPRKMNKVFRVRTADLMSSAELLAAGTIEQFDVPTLKKLYGTASDFQKRIMLTALFTGATQMELAVLEKSEFDLNAGVLSHHRNKTKVLGRYWLPPELVELLRKDFKNRKDDPLAFRTINGGTLVTFRDGRKTSDAVHQSWDDLRAEAEIPNALSFKYLRKFLADFCTRHGGETMGMIALSHSRQTVLARHYTTAKDFDTFNGLQRKMYAELVAGKMFAVAKPNAKAA